MRRRRTRKDLYEYHLEKSQKEEQRRVESVFGHELREAKEDQETAWKTYTDAGGKRAFVF
jgi:hypothetical protein